VVVGDTEVAERAAACKRVDDGADAGTDIASVLALHSGQFQSPIGITVRGGDKHDKW